MFYFLNRVHNLKYCNLTITRAENYIGRSGARTKLSMDIQLLFKSGKVQILNEDFLRCLWTVELLKKKTTHFKVSVSDLTSR